MLSTSSSTSEVATAPAKVAARLSDAACRWMAGLYDPRATAEEVSVPHGIQLSQKVKTFIRGSFSTGTTGYGFISVSPQAMLTSDQAPATWTTANSVGTGADAQSNFTLQAGNTVFANSTFQAASYGLSSTNLLTWKLAGCALYVKYAGTELNRGGDMVLTEQPGHATLSGSSYTGILGFDFSKRVSVTNEWQHINWTPNSDAECEWSPASPIVASFPRCLTIMAASAGSPQPFDFEIYCCFEVVGQLARSATLSFEDPIGYSAILGASNQYQQLDSVLGADGFVHAVEDQLANMSGVGRNATHRQNWAALAAFLPALASIATSALSGAARGAIKGMGVKLKKTPDQKEKKLAKAITMVNKKMGKKT